LDAERLHDLSPERRARIYRARRIRVLIGAIATGTLLAGTAVAAASTFSKSETTTAAASTRRSDDGTRRRMTDAAGRKASANRAEQEDWEFSRLVAETRRQTERRTAEAEAAVAAAEQRQADQAAAKAKAAEQEKATAAAEAEQAATGAERIAKAKQAAKAEKAAELAAASGRDSTPPADAPAACHAAGQRSRAGSRQEGRRWQGLDGGSRPGRATASGCTGAIRFGVDRCTLGGTRRVRGERQLGDELGQRLLRRPAVQPGHLEVPRRRQRNAP
jgi:hypothetical protein